jgi:hypothetical protein
VYTQAASGESVDAETAAYARVLLGDPCSYCGEPNAVVIDHITPTFHGGQTTANNLTVACRSCNVRKRRKPLIQAFAYIAHTRWLKRQMEGGKP